MTTNTVIELSDVLQWMESNKPFSLEAVKYDRNRHTGGEIMKFHHAVLVSQHAKMGTIRLKTNSGHLRDIHTRLIIQFNGKRVIW